MRSLLDVYGRLYGQTALAELIAREGIEITPMKPRHFTPERRQDLWAGVREEVARAQAQVAR